MAVHKLGFAELEITHENYSVRFVLLWMCLCYWTWYWHTAIISYHQPCVAPGKVRR